MVDSVVHVLAAAVAFALGLALKAFLQRRFFLFVKRVTDALPRSFVKRWEYETQRLTDDGDFPGAVPATQSEIDEMYARQAHLRQPNGVTLYLVKERITVAKIRKTLLGWVRSERRLRIASDHCSETTVTGRWFDPLPNTAFRGDFVVSFDRGFRVGIGIWTGPAIRGDGVRVFPWNWQRIDAKPQLRLVSESPEIHDVA